MKTDLMLYNHLFIGAPVVITSSTELLPAAPDCLWALERVQTCRTVSTPLWLLDETHCLELLGFSLKRSWKEVKLFFIFYFFWYCVFAASCAARRPNRENPKRKWKQTQSALFRLLWPVIRMGCGFESGGECTMFNAVM